MPRRSFLVAMSALLIGIVTVPARERLQADTIPHADPVPAPVAIPAAVRSELLLFARLNAKAVRESALFTELKGAITKAVGAADWDRFETQFGKHFELELKPTEIDAVTVCVVDAPAHGPIEFVIIVEANKPIPKAGVFGLKPGAKPDARGFYAVNRDDVAHFPDDKTVVLLQADLAQKYLDGYAKNRTDWPLTAELTKAAADHTAFATVRVDRIRADVRRTRDLRTYGPLFEARTATLTFDLKEKDVSVAARATFANAIAAGKARHKVHALVGLVSDEIDAILTGKIDLGGLRPAVQEAERALAAARIETDGSDLIASGRYTASFDFGVALVEAVKRIREVATEQRAQNNLKQCCLALHNYASTYGEKIPIHGIGPKGELLKKADDKPLLSWRVALLPFIEENALYNAFKLNEPWDSEHNKKLIAKMPAIFAPVTKTGKVGYTHIQMVVGPTAMKLPFATFPASFPDGTSNTIALVEAAEPVIWTKPDDVMFPDKELPKDFRKRFGGQFPGGFHVGLWDGSVRFVPDTMSDKTLGYALCPDDGQVLGQDW